MADRQPGDTDDDADDDGMEGDDNTLLYDTVGQTASSTGVGDDDDDMEEEMLVLEPDHVSFAIHVVVLGPVYIWLRDCQ